MKLPNNLFQIGARPNGARNLGITGNSFKLVSVLVVFTCFQFGFSAKNTFAITVPQYLSEAPNISECVAEVCRYSYGANGETNIDCRFVLLRWQANAYFYREASTRSGLSTTNLEPGYAVLSKYEDSRWFIDPNSVNALLMSDDGDNSLNKQTSTAFYSKGGLVSTFGLFDCIPNMVPVQGMRILPFTNATGKVKMSGSFLPGNSRTHLINS